MAVRPRGGSRSLVELLSVTLILLVLPLGLLSLFALEGYERYLGPELRQQADTVGRAVVSRVERALRLGIPLDRLVGVEEYLAPIVRNSDSLGFIALLDGDGRVIHAGEAVGTLVVGVPLSFLRHLLEEITFDTGIVLLVGLLVAFELLLLVVSTNLTFPLGLVRHLMADIGEGRGVQVVAVPVRNEVGRLLAELNRAVRVIGGKPAEDPAADPPAPEEG